MPTASAMLPRKAMAMIIGALFRAGRCGGMAASSERTSGTALASASLACWKRTATSP